ncbi:N-acetylmuramoyl-L-alanine amidase [Verrucomicrobiaceae bacterium N1E253]|uniref:N-acetylmuramoyl-L-alanine amidase n=1 Tax=Oceaniferula marina TaxID=2748318 RepID=A0A851GR56_9BACT|nr:N-acetylmuramoyl-L-alanine amidase [Oceaniferula marina]NWK56684.1 N-acetylmuramoyl-L-alanine amidase [Oceaniferula marina]
MIARALHLFTFITLLFCAFTPSANAQQAKIGFQWRSVELRGKAYIPLEQIKSFYQLQESKRKNQTLTLENRRTQIEITIGEQKIRINRATFYLSEPVIESADTIHLSALDLRSLIDPVMRPAKVARDQIFNTVVLDPGHGGKDRGSAKQEASLTLSLAEKTRELLVNQGYRVVMTRTEDQFVSLGERVRIAQAEANAILLSIHFNAGQKNTHGLETYIISAREPHPAAASSVTLATAVHSRSLLYLNDPMYGNQFQIVDRGIKHAKFSLLKGVSHPAILIEAGFLTHEEEAAKIHSEAYQNALAKSFVRGIEVYRASIQKKP